MKLFLLALGILSLLFLISGELETGFFLAFVTVVVAWAVNTGNKKTAQSLKNKEQIIPRKGTKNPPALPSKNIPFQWVSFSQPTRVQDYRLEGGFYASGQRQNSISEPSTITVNDVVTTPASPNSFSQSYYPTYVEMTPAEKGSYLAWLAGGLKDPDPSFRNAGYLFLYFYALERRALANNADLQEVILKTAHLLETYGNALSSKSFLSYTSEFLHFLGARLEPTAYRKQWPHWLTLHPNKVSEDTLALIGGNLVTLEEPLDAETAYLFAERHDDSRRSVVVSRTAEKFRQLFSHRFEEIYPQGLLLRAAKRDRKVIYRTANASLTPRLAYHSLPADTFSKSVPNVFGLKGQFKKLPQIWNTCIEELSGYSRAVLKVANTHEPAREVQLAAHLALPKELQEKEENPLADEFRQLIAECPSDVSMTLVPCAALAKLAGLEKRTTLTLKQSKDLATLVESLGARLSPNPELLQLPLRWDQFLAVRDLTDKTAQDHSELVGLLKLAYLNVLVAAADGHVADDEMAFFDRARETVSLTPMQETELSVTMTVLLSDTTLALKNLNRLAKSVPEANRHPVFLYLMRVAASDGIITSDEQKILLKIQKAFGLSEALLEEIMAQEAEFRTVEVSKGKHSDNNRSEAIPQPTKNEATESMKPESKPSFTLDLDRIAELSAETRQVVAVLGQLLDDGTAEEEEELEEGEVATEAFPDWTDGLDGKLIPALLEVAAHDSISSVELNELCEKYHLMASPFIDEVNEWSDEALGDFLLEQGSDQALTIYRELLASED